MAKNQVTMDTSLLKDLWAHYNSIVKSLHTNEVKVLPSFDDHHSFCCNNHTCLNLQRFEHDIETLIQQADEKYQTEFRKELMAQIEEKYGKGTK